MLIIPRPSSQTSLEALRLCEVFVTGDIGRRLLYLVELPHALRVKPAKLRAVRRAAENCQQLVLSRLAAISGVRDDREPVGAVRQGKNRPGATCALRVYSMINSPFIFLCAKPQTSEH